MELIPPPEGDREAPLQALIIDSWFDNYLGVVSLVRVKQGTLHKRDKIVAKSIGKAHQVDFIPPGHYSAWFARSGFGTEEADYLGDVAIFPGNTSTLRITEPRQELAPR